MLALLFCCSVITIYIGVTGGLELTHSYGKGPVALTSSATLFYEVNASINTARFALVINDSKVFTDGAAWVGIGIGEPTSGSMVGADIATAHFEPGAMNSCSIVDRYVPFVAFPWDEAPSIFPLVDDSPEPDWTLVSCERDKSGAVVLEIDRPLSVKDDRQDRAILAGDSAVMHAYGREFGYHDSNRHSAIVALYNVHENRDSDEATDDVHELPSDIDGFFDIRATNYQVPRRTTTYACTSMRIPLPSDKDYMIVGGNPLIDDVNTSVIHHFIVFLCFGDEYYNTTKNTVVCVGRPLQGPFGNSKARCTTIVSGYAKGMSETLYPEDVGVLINSSDSYLLIQTHYNNPNLSDDIIDNSGIRIFYTSKIRKHRASSLMLGDPFDSHLSKVISGFRYQHTCPSACTLRFSDPINIFASMLHMHETGKEAFNNIYHENNTFVRNLNKVNFWSYGFQRTRIFDDPIVLRPGQQMQTVCVYDTSKRPKTKFGIATEDEMCIEYLMYWPVQTDPKTGHEINICSYVNFRGSRPTTLCGDNSRVGEMFAEKTASNFPHVYNPSFDDTEGAPTNFGVSSADNLNDAGDSGVASSSKQDDSLWILWLLVWKSYYVRRILCNVFTQPIFKNCLL